MGFAFITITRDWQRFVVFVQEILLLTFFWFFAFALGIVLGIILPFLYLLARICFFFFLLLFVTVEIKKRKTLEYAFALPCCVKKKKAEGTSSWFKT